MINFHVSDDLKKYRLIAADGEIGSVSDFFFDQPGWDVRYLVVDTGSWLDGREILVSPVAVGRIHEEDKTIDIELTKWQLENSPVTDGRKSVSRQYEERYYRHFNWTPYWEAKATDPRSAPVLSGNSPAGQEAKAGEQDTGLKSESEITGFNINAHNRKVGYVRELIVDSYYWTVGYLVIDVRKWFRARTVLLHPASISEVNWSDKSICVEPGGDVIRSAPVYDRSKPISRDYEMALFSHYGLNVKWNN